jgi:hypothetical protein
VEVKSHFALVDKIQGYAVIASSATFNFPPVSNNEVQDFNPEYPDFLEYVVPPRI